MTPKKALNSPSLLSFLAVQPHSAGFIIQFFSCVVSYPSSQKCNIVFHYYFLKQNNSGRYTNMFDEEHIKSLWSHVMNTDMML